MAEKPKNLKQIRWIQEVSPDGSIINRPSYEAYTFKPPPSEIIEARVKSSLSSENATSSSFAISASYATNALSASYAVSASVEIKKEVSSSYADTASFAQSGDGIFSGSFSGSYEGDGSQLTNITSASYAVSSSFAPNLYSSNGSIGSSRTVTITDTLTLTGGQEIRIVNGRTYREITQTSDLPTTLVANTTYIFKGEISVSNNITCNVDGVEFKGSNREEDGIIWTGTGAFLTLTDCNFDFSNIKFSSTTSGNSILDASNVAASGYNNNRLKVLAFVNCQFRGTYDVMDVKGYDLVDINNTLFFYIKATNFGLRFQDTSKLEMSSCELIRWFDETTIPTPSGYSTVSMIELQNNNLASFGAVNINGCIVHPQQTQNGINIGTSSTTGFGTISSNAFINVDLTTGKIFLPELNSLPDYSQAATYNFDIFANQGLLNSTSGCVMTLTDNTNDTDLTNGVPTKIETDGLAVAQASVRFNVATDGRCTYVGTKQVYVSIHAAIGYDKQGGGNDNFVFYLYKNGRQLPGSQTKLRTNSNDDSLSMVYGTLMEENDYIEVYVEVVGSNDDMLIKDWQVVIRE